MVVVTPVNDRTFYRSAILLPFVGLAIAAILVRPSRGLPPGWEWVYPTSLTRSVMVYALLAAWLWIRLDQRGPAGFARLVWWSPVLFAALSWLFMLMLSLLRGRAGELWAEQSGAILLRTAVHLVIGYGYVWLVSVARGLLRNEGAAPDDRAKER